MSRRNNKELHDAAYDGDIEKVKALMKKGADPNWETSNGWIALHAASLGGHKSIVDFLLTSGKIKDINQTNGYGKTALMIASSYPTNGTVRQQKNGFVGNYTEVSATLIHAGVDLSVTNSCGESAAQIAAKVVAVKGYSVMELAQMCSEPDCTAQSIPQAHGCKDFCKLHRDRTVDEAPQVKATTRSATALTFHHGKPRYGVRLL